MKVTELVAEQQAYGWSSEELHFQHPYLTMGQIHAALAYYWDNQEALESEIEQAVQANELFRKQHLDSPLRQRLKAKGVL